MTLLLDVQDLHVSFHRRRQVVRAVRGASFKIFEGETVGFVGESGSGKSALVRTLARLLSKNATIDQGEIWYKGKNLLEFSPPELQKVRGKEIGMIFQDPMTSLTPTMKIGQQIAEAFLCHYPNEDPHPIVLNLLKKVGISDPERRLGEYPHTLSGGMRQRVMIAIALAANPSLLIADEPTTALDVTVQAQILALIQDIQKEKTTILITHDLSLAAGFCSRIIVMYAGEIVEDAPALQIFSSPQHPYTQRLLSATARLDLPHNAALTPISGQPPDLSRLPPGCSFAPRCSQAMQICRSQSPPAFDVGPSHCARCWLHDPRHP
ncbi:MAG: ABC transporter ATP-binding protein [Verrucomicrobia bacterium]|nr:ABC transporter ATP-binding protein [Verrucomicrobiota bacterium]